MSLPGPHSGGAGGGGGGGTPTSVPPNQGAQPAGAGAGEGAGGAGAVGTPIDPSMLWAKTQQLPEDAFRQLQSIYGEHFPLEARHHLAGWLEASFQDELDAANPQHEEHARNLVVALVQQLEAKAAESADFLVKNKLDQIVENIKVSALAVTEIRTEISLRRHNARGQASVMPRF